MNLIGYVSNDETGYYRFNAHGDVVAVVDTAGEIITEYSYDPFGKLEDDGNEWLKILFGLYIEDSNPFRYCAEYYDSETEFIYLRARYYSPELQRFISEDLIRDGNNWYLYCGNNPVIFIDPMGTYYITESFDITYDIFGHCFRNSTGTYTLHPETWLTYSAKSALSFLPYGLGTAITWIFEGSANVVGGSSSTQLLQTVTDAAPDLLGALLGNWSEIVSDYSGKIFTAINIYQIVRKIDEVELDSIAFDLLTRNEISLSSTSKEELENTMKKVYDFITINGDYFSLKIDGEHTMYEIDKKMQGAWFKDWDKSNFVANYRNKLEYLINDCGDYELGRNRDRVLKAYENLIDDYENRINYVDEVFLNYMIS